MAWLYLPDTVVLKSESTPHSVEYIPWLTLSGKATQRPLSWHGWKSRPWIKLLFGMTLAPLTADRGVESWILSLRASRANRSVSLETSEAQTMSAGYGKTLSESFARFSPDGSLVKTSLDLFLMDSAPYSEALPASGMMLAGELFEQTKWEPVTAENASSFSPSEGTAWTTPTSSQNGGRTQVFAQGGIPLQLQSMTWPTPDASAHKYRLKGDSQQSKSLEPLARSSHQDLQISTCGPDCSPNHRRLNPAFVEWLMGLPSGWTIAKTGSGPVVTEWSLYKQQLRSECLRLARAGR